MNRDGWTYKKLGDISQIFDSERKPVTQKNRTKGNIPYYGASGIQDYVSEFIFDGRYLLIGEDGAKWGAGDKSSYIIEGKSWVNNHVHIIRLHDESIDTFVSYYLNFKDLSNFITGAVVPKLTQGSMRNIPIPVPSKATQQSIVSELDSINDSITLLQQQVKELDSLTQSLFYDTFGDPITNPKRWDKVPLRDFCNEIKYGTSNPSCENGKYKYLRMCNLSYYGYLDLTDLKRIDIPEDEVEKCIVRKGDILFNRTNSMELIGKTCMFDCDEPMIIAGYIIRVRLNDKLNPVVMARMFNLPSMKKLLRSMAKGAVNQANINSKELSSILVPVLPTKLQQAFASKVSTIEGAKDDLNNQIAEMQTLLNARMQYWFD